MFGDRASCQLDINLLGQSSSSLLGQCARGARKVARLRARRALAIESLLRFGGTVWASAVPGRWSPPGLVGSAALAGRPALGSAQDAPQKRNGYDRHDNPDEHRLIAALPRLAKARLQPNRVGGGSYRDNDRLGALDQELSKGRSQKMETRRGPCRAPTSGAAKATYQGPEYVGNRRRLQVSLSR